MAHGKSLEKYYATIRVTHVAGEQLGFFDKSSKKFVATPKEVTVDKIPRPALPSHGNKEWSNGNRTVNPASYNKKHTRGRQLVTQIVPAKEIPTGSKALGTFSIIKTGRKLIRRLTERYNPFFKDEDSIGM